MKKMIAKELIIFSIMVIIGITTSNAQTGEGTLKWKYLTEARVQSCPAIVTDGTIYFGSDDNNLYALNSDGTLKWKYLTKGVVSSSPSIGSDGTIYVGSNDNYIYAINGDGSLKWKYQVGGIIQSSPAISSDGTVYVGSYSNNMYAINSDGTLKWSFTTENYAYSDPSIGEDGTVYFGAKDHKIYAVDQNGNLKWSVTTGERISASPAIGADGTIYVGVLNGMFYAFNTDGSIKWSYDTGKRIEQSAAIGADGTIYFGTAAGNKMFYALNPDGTFKWSYNTESEIVSAPAVGADRTIYFGSNDSYLYALNPDGTLKWQYQTGSGIYSSPAIYTDGTVYIGSNDSYLYAINSSSDGLAESSWPKFHRDAQNKGSKQESSIQVPVASFTASLTSGTAPLTVQFTDQSTNTPTSWSWDFGDGNTSTSQNPSHTYNTPGTYTVSLTVSNSAGSDTETKTNYITVNLSAPILSLPSNDSTSVDISPTLSWNASSGAASYTLQVSENNIFSSYIYNQDVGNVTSKEITGLSYGKKYYWRVQASASGVSSEWSTTFNFTTVSIASIDLISDFNGYSDVMKDTAGMSISWSSGETDLLIFRLLDSNGNTVMDSTGYLILTAWNTSYTIQNPGGGKLLRLSNESGGYNNASFQDTLIAVLNDKNYGYGPGYAVFDGSKISYSKATYISFKATYSGDSNIYSTNSTNTLQFVNHRPKLVNLSPSSQSTPVDINSYTSIFTISVSDSFGNICSNDKVRVSSHIGTGEIFYGTSSASVNNSLGTGGDIDLDVAGKAYIKMKVVSTDPVDSLIIQALEVHTGEDIIVPPLSNNNLRKTIAVEINTVEQPSALFVADDTMGISPLTVQFTDQSTNTPTSWSWDFGDENTSTEQNPSHIYNNPGIYTVSLTVSNSAGSDTEIKAGFIIVFPHITFTTQPTERSIIVDGSEYTSPVNFTDWAPGSSHTISVNSPQTIGDSMRYIFEAWSDSGNQTHTLTVPSNDTTYTATFDVEYYLTTSVNPADGGDITPPSPGEWYKSGTIVEVTASPWSGFYFTGFSGDLSGNTTQQQVTMDKPRSVTANFSMYPSITINTIPEGKIITIDGSDYTSPSTFSTWEPGSNHTISVSSPQSIITGTQYVYDSWSDGGNQTHSITVPSFDDTITASFETQFYLTTSVSDSSYGTISPAPPGQWYDSSAVVTVTATPNSGYKFSEFSGSLTGDTTPQNLTIDSPKNVTANFIPINPEITLLNTSLEFDTVIVDSSKVLTFTIKNEGNADLIISDIKSDDSHFTVSHDSMTIKAGQSQIITVTFTPTMIGIISGTITIKSNDSDESTLTVSVSGTGTTTPVPEITVSVTSINFGTVNVGESDTMRFTLHNEGTANLIVNSITSNNDAFAVNPTSLTITPSGIDTVTVIYMPSDEGDYSAEITVTSNDEDEGIIIISLSGTGNFLEPEITLSTTFIDLDTISVDSSKTEIFTINNDGEADLVVSDISVDDNAFTITPTSVNLTPGDSQIVSVRFTPVNAGDYSGTITITSNDGDEGTLTVSLQGACKKITAYFSYTADTGVSYNILINSINYIDLKVGDEIGVFDVTSSGDTICVGALIDSGSYPLGLTAWADDSQTETIQDGYITGNTMIFKILDKSSMTEYQAQATYSSGDGTFGNGAYADISILNTTYPTFVKENIIVVSGYKLYDNYPNPFNPETIIKYDLPEECFVSINVYSLKGQLIATLINREQQPGLYEVTWHPKNISSGIYIYRLKAGDFIQSKKMLYLK